MQPSIQAVVDKYERVNSSRWSKLHQFTKGQRPFLVHINGPCTFYGAAQSIQESFIANISDFSTSLDFESDTLPYIEPWFGTGIYAQAFGCEYFWRSGDSPACHYKFKTIDQVHGLKKPDIRDCTMLHVVQRAIEYFLNETEGKIPICLTDTQSPNDIATLILDAVEVFTAMYSEPVILKQFLQIITDLVIEFSSIQKQMIGAALASPGHIMSSSIVGGRGISISDDNLAVCSPELNKQFLLPYDTQIANAFGGAAIHSCGNWAHTMPILAKMPEIFMIDCALATDPSPNLPELVRDSFKSSGKIVQVRIGSDVQVGLDLIRRLWASDLRLIICMDGQDETCKLQYRVMTDLLTELYGCD